MKYILSILIGLAAGCLAGDAILHLIPHAFENVALLTGGGDAHDDHRLLEEDDHDEHEGEDEHGDHSGGIKIGLSIIGGFCFF